MAGETSKETIYHLFSLVNTLLDLEVGTPKNGNVFAVLVSVDIPILDAAIEARLDEPLLIVALDDLAYGLNPL
jgi:hypothetical protein